MESRYSLTPRLSHTRLLDSHSPTMLTPQKDSKIVDIERFQLESARRLLSDRLSAQPKPNSMRSSHATGPADIAIQRVCPE